MPSTHFQYIKSCITGLDSSSESSLGRYSETLERISKAHLLAHPAVVHEKDEGDTCNGKTLLHYAVEHRSIEFCKLILEHDAEAAKHGDSLNRLPFHYSCDFGYLEIAKYLYQFFPDCIEIADAHGNYPIHGLLQHNTSGTNISGLTRFLLHIDRGAVSKPNNQGLLPLHIACRRNRNLNIIKRVFDVYPEALYKRCLGETPLEIARRKKRGETASFFCGTLSIIRQAREDTLPDENGQLPIHRFINNPQISLETVKLMLKANPDSLTASDNQGQIPLHIAVEYRGLCFVKCLVESNVESLNIPDLRGNCALHHACLARKYDIIDYVLRISTLAAFTQNLDGKLPLHLLLYGKNETCKQSYHDKIKRVKYLYQLYPESLNIADSHGNYPIHGLLRYNKSGANISEITQFLLDHDQGALSKPNNQGLLPLHIACGRRGLGIIKQIFDAYPEAFLYRCRGETPFDIARSRGRTASFDRFATFFAVALVEIRQAGEDTTPDENGQLPIHRGLIDRELSLGAVKLMLKANPTSIDVADNEGNIPLYLAIKHADVSIVRHLIEANIESLKASDSSGNCALHLACLAGKCDIINCILEKSTHGASIRNLDGKLPIQLLMYDAKCDRGSLGYTGAVHHLLFAYPNVQDIAFEQICKSTVV